MAVRVTIGSNTKRNEVTVSGQSTVRELFQEQGINISKGSIHLNGATLSSGDLDRTLDELNVGDSCTLLSVVKGDAAHKFFVKIAR